MEVLLEILLEFLLQVLLFFGEFVFTIIGEGLFDWFGGKVAAKRKAVPAGPILTAIAYFAFGALCGVISLLIASGSFIASPALRILNLVASPLLAGFLLTLWRSYATKSDETADFMATFINGALLAFALSGIRFAFAH